MRFPLWLILLAGLAAGCNQGGASGTAATSFEPQGGDDVAALSPRILDGLSTDERVLECALDEASGRVQLDPGRLVVHRVDLDGDPHADWLVTSAWSCLKSGERAPWWVFQGIGAAAGRESDGPPLRLRTEAARIELLDTRHAGLRDLRVFASMRGLSAVYRFDGQAYSAFEPPSTDGAAGSAQAPGERQLMDFRTPGLPAEPQLEPARREAVLRALYGDGGARDQATINSAVRGRFTAEAGEQTLYLVQRGGPRAAEPGGTVQLALFAGEEFRRSFDWAEGNFIVATPDLDRDGVQELLIRGDSYQMGEILSYASLVSLTGDRPQRLARFDNVREDRCAGAPLSREVVAARIVYQPSGQRLPTFGIQRYRAACMEDDRPPPADAFTPLP